MKIVLLADITAGHILPLLKIQSELKKRNDDVEVVAFEHKISRSLIKNGQFYKPFNSFKEYTNFLKIFDGYDKKTVFISGGGRITLVFLGLYTKGYKNLYTYEFNAIFGRSNKLIQPFVKKTFTYFPFKKKKCLNVGSPLEFKCKEQILNKELKKILFLTGSNGSEEVFKLADELSGYDITISTGVKEYKFKSKVKTCGFIQSFLYTDYDLIVARSGAGTIADIISYRVPVIFIPSKHVKADHQKKNVLALQKYTKIKFLDYEKQDKEHLEELIEYYKPKETREDLIKSYNGFFHDDVLNKVLDEIEKNV